MRELNVAILGAGNIGSTIHDLLVIHGHPDYKINSDLYDKEPKHGAAVVDIDLDNLDLVYYIVKDHDVIISALPYNMNDKITSVVASEAGKLYFDLTEDIRVGKRTRDLNRYNPAFDDKDGDRPLFFPHCGLAPGIVGNIAYTLASHFDELKDVKIRVGALTPGASNMLRYNRTWSTNGLVNEYIKRGQAIVHGNIVETESLTGLESVIVNGIEYEAFNTSGGMANVLDAFMEMGSTTMNTNVNYKTLRYPGHCHLMKFLLKDLDLHEHDVVRLLDEHVPSAPIDVVVILVEVSGWKNNNLTSEVYSKCVFMGNSPFTAIQMTTASGVLLEMFYRLKQRDWTSIAKIDDIGYGPFWDAYAV
jgi:saccharopine dehydrogenase-like NADP-dependent oxidoreductase